MSSRRRPLALLALALTSFALAACSQTTAPRRDDSTTLNPDGTWSYDEVTVLTVQGRTEPFRHTDHNTLTKIGEPTPNPLMRRPSTRTWS